MCERYINLLPLAHPQLRTQPATQAGALAGNRTSDPLVHRLALNPLNHTRASLLSHDCNLDSSLLQDLPTSEVRNPTAPV